MYIPNIGRFAGLLLGAAVAVSAFPVLAADNYVLGICQVSQQSLGAEISPTYDGDIYLYEYRKEDPRYQGFTFHENTAKISLVNAPAQGKVKQGSTEISDNYYHYMPHKGYVGQDRFVMQVEKNGIKVRIQYLIEVPFADEPTGHMCNPGHWKISATTPTLDNASLQAILSAWSRG